MILKYQRESPAWCPRLPGYVEELSSEGLQLSSRNLVSRPFFLTSAHSHHGLLLPGYSPGLLVQPRSERLAVWVTAHPPTPQHFYTKEFWLLWPFYLGHKTLPNPQSGWAKLRRADQKRLLEVDGMWIDYCWQCGASVGSHERMKLVPACLG